MFARHDSRVAAPLPLLVADCGICRLPHFLAVPAVGGGSLVRLFPGHASDVVALHAVDTHRKTLPTKARVFVDAVAADLADRKSLWTNGSMP